MTVVAFTYGITSAKDVDKATALEKAVSTKTTSIHRFVRNSATLPDGPPIYVTPGSRAILTLPPLIGNPYHNTERYSVINDHTATIEGLQDGKMVWWGTISISKDGKTRTATLHSHDANGRSTG